MYIMRVCLFSALSRRVGALQISVIIIIIIEPEKYCLQGCATPVRQLVYELFSDLMRDEKEGDYVCLRPWLCWH